jgi:uncharacterized protein
MDAGDGAPGFVKRNLRRRARVQQAGLRGGRIVHQTSNLRSAGLLCMLALAAGCADKADTRYTGAYQLEDGRLVFVTPREGDVLRYRLMSGDSGAMWPTGEGAYESGPGWAEREPVVSRFEFERARDRTNGLNWRSGEREQRARALDLPERTAKFASGDLELRAKLVTPRGEAPFPAIVLVHGSGDESAVDYYFEPYLYAAHGFASLVFDKRGTGESEGDYLQNFHVLSDDVVAAVQWLRTQPDVDPDNIHLAGFSQGGWIAPLAALKDQRIRSVLVGYGVMKPVTSEDRWGYVYALRQKGFGDAEIAAADRINALIEDIVDRHMNRWSELDELVDSVRAEPWFEAVKGSDSMLGAVAEQKFPLWGMRAYVWWKLGAHREPAFIDRLYDPAPTMQQLSIPSLWILAGEDSSAPAQWTVDELQKLQAAGKPVEYFVYPEAEHGILRFSAGVDGERKMLGYEPDYFERQIAWFRRQSGSSAEANAVTKLPPNPARNSATLGAAPSAVVADDAHP